MTRAFGGQSMVARLRRVLVKRPDEGPEEAAAWSAFGYHRPADIEAARCEHEGLVRLLREAGSEVVYAQEPQPERLDAIFVTDAGLITDVGAIVGRMGKPLRRGEEAALAREWRDSASRSWAR